MSHLRRAERGLVGLHQLGPPAALGGEPPRGRDRPLVGRLLGERLQRNPQRAALVAGARRADRRAAACARAFGARGRDEIDEQHLGEPLISLVFS